MSLSSVNNTLISTDSTPLKQLEKKYHEKDYQSVVDKGDTYLQSEEDPDIRLYTGLAYYQLREYDKAIEVLKPALSAYPKYLDVRLGLVRAYMAQGDNHTAYTLILDGLILQPGNVALLYQKASLEIAMQKNSEAKQTLNILLKIKADYEPALQLKKNLDIAPTEKFVLAKEQLPYDEEYFKSLYQSKQYEEVIKKGKEYIRAYPNAVDVRYYIGLSYYQQKKYPQANDQFLIILQQHPDYLDTREALISTLFAMEDYPSILKAATEGLQIKPDSIHLLMAKAKVFILEKNYEAAGQQIAQIQLVNENYLPALELRKKLNTLIKESLKKSKPTTSLPPEEIKKEQAIFPRYTFSAGTSIMDVTLPRQYWNFSSMSLYREAEHLNYGAIMNYARRLGMEAVQGGIAVNPQINKDTWFETSYYYANSPSLFPDHTVYGEMFQNLFGAFTVSAGNTYRKIAKTYFNTYTANLTTYAGSYSFSFRPFIYRTKSGPNSILYRMSLHYDFDDPDQYVEVAYYTGYSPDLFDLTTVDFFKVHEQIIMVKAQAKISNALMIQIGGGYENQKFLNNRQRELTYLNLGLKYRMENV
ncbi:MULTISPECIES: tetratricopeptide repeat protein [unclassified Legionella]|uniref:tetratricopeptide repeat protein n=1 Tax=unclassified Legionella TaxID=2622702 RepID=UPI0013EF8E04|nr:MULTISPECIES: tetratricopeptide repeat protein [unclassified Legionella]MDI9819352.1 YaiO family outer membrane beta-barrel protein [Legionella sp. PL877]